MRPEKAIALAWMALLLTGCPSPDPSEPAGGAPTAPGSQAGLSVVSVKAGYPAARAGLEAGDRIVAVAGRRLETPGLATWSFLEVEEGTLGPVTLGVERADRRLELEVSPAPWGLEVAPFLPQEVSSALAAAGEPDALAGLTAAIGGGGASEEVWATLELAARAWSAEDRAEALDVAIRTAGEVGDPTLEGWAWWQRGQLEWRNNAHAEAQVSLERAAELLASRPLAEAAVRLRRGISFFNTTRHEAALAEFELAAERIRGVAAASTGLAHALDLSGQIHRNRNELELAEARFAEAEALLLGLDADHLQAAQIQYQYGNLAALQGDLAEAGRRFDRAAAVYRDAGVEDRNTASTLMGMSFLASVRGDLDLAEERIRRGLEIFEADAEGSPHHIWALRNLADVHSRRGWTATASKILDEALSLSLRGHEEPGATAGEVHWTYAEVAERGGDVEASADHYRRALEIFEKTIPTSAIVDRVRTDLGRVMLELGNLEGAKAALESAAANVVKTSPGGLWDGWVRFQLGRLARREARLEDALVLLRAAHGPFRRLAPDTVAESEILHSIAGTLLELGRREEALETYLRAVEVLERQLPRLGSPEVGAEVRARNRDLYDDTLALLLELGRPEEAFHLLERSRARAFLAVLGERDLVFRAALSPELDRERRAARAAHATALDRLGTLTGTSAEEQVAAALRDLELAVERQERVGAEIRREAPRVADLAAPEPRRAAELVAALPKGALALSYHVGPESTRIFALTGAGGLRVETAAVGADRLTDEVERALLLMRKPSAGDGLGTAPGTLAGWLLAPFRDEMEAAERLVLVLDGPLHLLPFGALPVPDRPDVYLAAHRPLQHVASLTLYAELLARRSVGAGGRLTAFGDPGVGKRAELPESRGEPLPALEAARREVDSIAELYAPHSSAYLGSAASESAAREAAPGSRILHFATHATLNERFPLDSALLLAGDDSEHDGILRAWEVLQDLDLDADLVALSACESALGVELPGEGLVGLTRAFHHAGARSVLAALWPVSDRSTEWLMQRFYEGLRSGLPRDEALRQAQRSLIEAPLPAKPRRGFARLAELFSRRDEAAELDASHPYYWAAFQLHGDGASAIE